MFHSKMSRDERLLETEEELQSRLREEEAKRRLARLSRSRALPRLSTSASANEVQPNCGVSSEHFAKFAATLQAELVTRDAMRGLLVEHSKEVCAQLIAELKGQERRPFSLPGAFPQFSPRPFTVPTDCLANRK
jgi:hypothetical protein|mmetsp:Transcript_39852/g.109757  ORF Transcript_39852/g.109757 Transcript_39852/m.109757 type:complete len:134 (+) Transcript_39852:1123-1524(+)